MFAWLLSSRHGGCLVFAAALSVMRLLDGCATPPAAPAVSAGTGQWVAPATSAKATSRWGKLDRGCSYAVMALR